MKNIELVFMEDPGHGWLAVPIEYIAELGIFGDITSYSYYDHKIRYAYLEGDCDAPTFIRASKERGWNLEIVEEHTNNESSIRHLPSYPWAITS